MANNGTPTTVQNLISGVSAYTPIAESDLIRYTIIQLNNALAGLATNVAPTTQQIEDSATQLEQLQSPKMLNAILLQLVLSLLGGATGRSQIIYGSGAPNGVAFGTIGDLYVDIAAFGLASRFYVKNTGQGTNTGWTNS